MEESLIRASHLCISCLADDWLLWRSHHDVKTQAKVAAWMLSYERGAKDHRGARERGKETERQERGWKRWKDLESWLYSVFLISAVSLLSSRRNKVSHELMYNSPTNLPLAASLPLSLLFHHHSLVFFSHLLFLLSIAFLPLKFLSPLF